MQEKEFLDFIEKEIQWHDKRAVNLKKRRIRIRILILGASASISLLAVFGSYYIGLQKEFAIVTAALANLTAILETAIQLNQCEMWVEYRQACQSLRWEKTIYLTGATDYEGLNQQEKLSIFVKNCGLVLSKTNRCWLESSRQLVHSKN